MDRTGATASNGPRYTCNQWLGREVEEGPEGGPARPRRTTDRTDATATNGPCNPWNPWFGREAAHEGESLRHRLPHPGPRQVPRPEGPGAAHPVPRLHLGLHGPHPHPHDVRGAARRRGRRGAPEGDGQ